MKKLSLDEYLDALERMKKSPRDRIGVLGELGITGIGVAGGAAASGTIAAAAGASTIFGSTTLGSLLGGMFVATTPIGWVIGTALAAGAVAYGATQLVRSASRFDAIKDLDIEEIETRIERMRQETLQTPLRPVKMKKVIEGVQYLVASDHLSQAKSTALLGAIERKQLRIEDAFQLIQKLLDEKAATKNVGSSARKHH